MHTRIEFDRKTDGRRLRTRHLPEKEQTPKTVYNRKKENKNWKKDLQ